MQGEEKARGGEEQAYWASLTKLKDTIRFMRTNEKLTTNGYSYKDHIFRGWKVQEKRALEYVHPQVVRKIRAEIEKRDSL
jgi:ribosomal protein L19E